MTRLLGSLVLLSISGFAVFAHAGDWPMARGNLARTGTTTETLSDSLDLLWRFEAPKGFDAEPVVADGTLYIGSLNGSFFAISLSDGSPRWETVLRAGVVTSACVRDGRVFVGDNDGRMVCVDAASGKIRWSYETEAELHSSPACENEKVLFGSYDQNLYCLDAADGSVLWKSETNGPVHCAPSVSKGRAYVAGCDHFLRAVDIASGKAAWSLEMESYASASPAVWGDRLYVGHFGARVVAADISTTPTLVWQYPETAIEFPFFASCAVNEKYVVATGRDKKVHCLDRATGKRRWVVEVGALVDASPCIAGERAYAATRGGVIFARNLADGAETWKYVCGPPFSAGPAVAAGRLLIGDAQGTLYCFGQRKGPQP